MKEDPEKNELLSALKTYNYPMAPKKNISMRKEMQVSVITNLFPIEYIDPIHKIYNYSIIILPSISDDNFPLKRVIQQRVEKSLPNEFKKIIFAGNNMYACITNKDNKDLSLIELTVSVQKNDYNVTLKLAKEIDFSRLDYGDKEDQQIKHIIENLLRFIIMRNPNVIKFKDGTMVNANDMNIESINDNLNDDTTQKIYKGYMTSVQITENGFFMRINDVNKIISGKSVLKKILELKGEGGNLKNNEKIEKINDYFMFHRTVLAKYGNLRTYRISNINFNKTPNNTSINIKDINGNPISVSLVNYYKTQYGIRISDENQPLIEVERPKKGVEKEVEIIYLIPELVYLTGIEDGGSKNENTTRRKITDKTKMKPFEKIKAIGSINDLINSTINKKYKNKKGEEISLKSAKEVKELYGIKMGNNLTIKGRIIPQPKLIFNRGEKFIQPNKGLFRSENPNKVIMFTNENLFYAYDEKERDQAIQVFNSLLMKCRNKKFTFSEDFHPKNIVGYCIKRTNTFGDVFNELERKIPRTNNHKFGFVFLSKNLERHYEELKNYFYKRLNLITQFAITKKLADHKRGNSIQFNLIDQFNIKIGGENHHINFVKENLLRPEDVYLVIGLKSNIERKTGKIKYCMTSTKNQFLNYINTNVKECNNNKLERQDLIKMMLKDAISKLMEHSPHEPNCVLLYRKGGNYIENLKLAIDEKDIFINVIKELEDKCGNNVKIPFYYICCNLKTDMKFFEYQDNNGNRIFSNPQSGLIIDENVTAKNRFEFFIQPQLVNQGTATPCHYQVMSTYQHSEEILKLEDLEKITFYLCYYYFTWAGAIREPGTLKMAETALDFSSKCFVGKSDHNDILNYYYNTPIYI